MLSNNYCNQIPGITCYIYLSQDLRLQRPMSNKVPCPFNKGPKLLLYLHSNKTLHVWLGHSECWMQQQAIAKAVNCQYRMHGYSGGIQKFRKGGVSHWCTKHTRKFLGCHAHFWSHLKQLEVRTEYLEATLGLVKHLEISKELIRECVTVPGCCAACHSCIII